MIKKIDLKNILPLLLVAWALIAGLSACSKSEELLSDEDNQEIVIKPTVLLNDVITRSAGVELEDIPSFYLRIINPVDSRYSYFVKVVKGTDGNWTAEDPQNAGVPVKLVFQNGTQPVKIQALYWNNSRFQYMMQTADISTWEKDFTFWTSTVSTYYSIKENDPLYFNQVFVPKTDAPGGVLPIRFHHRFTKVNLTLNFDEYTTNLIGYNQDAISEVSVFGLMTGNVKLVKWNFNTDAFDYNGDTRETVAKLYFIDFIPPTMTTNTSTYYELMAIPQIIPDGSLTVAFSIYDEEYRWTYQGLGLNFERNTEYDITLMVSGIDPATKSGDTSMTSAKKRFKITGSMNKRRKGGSNDIL